nr:AraC family transcriptional regulator [uncultured Desulfobacter sp.]
MERRAPIIIPAKNYYAPCLNLNIFLEKKDGYETFWNWSNHLNGISKGFVYQLKCQPGLILAISKQYPSTAVSISFEEEEKTNFVRLLFFLGEGSHLQHHMKGGKTTYCANHGYLTYGHNLRSELIHCPAKSFCVIGILMEPWFIKRFSQGVAGEFARTIEGMLAIQKQGDFFCYPVFMNPSINICIHEILGCTYIDARRHLFLGSKALELMRFGFDQFSPDKGLGTSCFNLETCSRDFVHKARDIMISDIKNPPSLTELSRMVGVNRTTLSQKFRKIYGVTIFNFLRNFRLEKSKRLLQAGNLSVTEVAFEVGYAQQRTFSKEFKKYFGDTPSDYLR